MPETNLKIQSIAASWAEMELSLLPHATKSIRDFARDNFYLGAGEILKAMVKLVDTKPPNATSQVESWLEEIENFSVEVLERHEELRRQQEQED